MAVREELLLDLSRALAQIDDLERELDALLQPIRIPVEIESDQAIRSLREEISRADADTIDVDVETGELSAAEREISELQQEIAEAVDDSDRFARSMNRAGDEAEGLGRRGRTAFAGMGVSLGGLISAVAAFQGFRILGRFFADSIEAASGAEESLSKVRVVFGEFGDDIEQFASTAPQALGLANREALAFAGTFGNLFIALGLSQQAAADLAPDIVQLGSDLASFNDIEVTDALDKLRAGLVGEAEPLRVLGVNLTAAAVAAKAVELGLANSTNEVSEAAKVQARYALILEQTTTAQGDFARTSESIANQQRTLRGEFENFRQEVGEALVPAFQAVLNIMPGVIDTLDDLVPVLADVAASFADIAGDGQGFIEFLENIPFAIGASIDVATGFGGAIGNIGEALEQLFRLNPAASFDATSEAVLDFQRTFDNISIRKIGQELIDALQVDEDPFRVLTDAVDELVRLDPDLESFADATEKFFTITGTRGTDAIRVFELLSTRAGDFALSAEQLAVLRDIMLEVSRAAVLIPPPLDELVQGVSNVGPPAQAAAQGIEAIADAVDEVDLADFEAEVADLEAQFARLPDGLDAARDALRDDENAIVEDFSDFLENLEDELGARQAFADNIEILRRLGLDDLATVFTDLGLDAAAALADAIANPAEAQRAEALLEEQARNQASAFNQAFIEALDPDLSVDVRANLIIDALGLQEALDDAPILRGNVVVPNVSATPTSTTVTNNFFTEPEPTTDTARIIQSANQIGNIR